MVVPFSLIVELPGHFIDSQCVLKDIKPLGLFVLCIDIHRVATDLIVAAAPGNGTVEEPEDAVLGRIIETVGHSLQRIREDPDMVEADDEPQRGCPSSAAGRWNPPHNPEAALRRYPAAEVVAFVPQVSGCPVVGSHWRCRGWPCPIQTIDKNCCAGYCRLGRPASDCR